MKYTYWGNPISMQVLWFIFLGKWLTKELPQKNTVEKTHKCDNCVKCLSNKRDL